MDEIINAMDKAQDEQKQAKEHAAKQARVAKSLQDQVDEQKRAHAAKYFYNRAHELCLVATGACLPLVHMYIEQNNALMAVGTLLGGYCCWALNRAFRWRANG